ncbi:MAG: heavy metal-binding domain-containing protein [Polyangiaceae bacterium]|nr:heavy metal-binding domain-containing protein [Polyangiaceae bacterium]
MSAQTPSRFFTSSASGTELYCHLDAGYSPIAFAMGNVAYALGLGRGLTGGLRTMAKGEVKEFSTMYDRIRHLALRRLKEEVAEAGANAVVDIKIEIRQFGPGVVELLMTGTASYHPRFAPTPARAEHVVTSELIGAELWNLARMGYSPVELVMATSVYSIGLVGGIGTMFSGLARGELDELTKLIYHAREDCLDLVRREAQELGAERVVGNKLTIRELSP